MQNNTSYWIILTLLLFSINTGAQRLQPGFNKSEYIELMQVSAQFGDSSYAARFTPPAGYRMIYRSPTMGLQNQWDLWQSPQGIPIISIRGTTKEEVSWLENFYAAMVPAKGSLKLSADKTFTYTLAQHPNAAVHVGWLIGTGFLSMDILPRIDSFYKKGQKEFYVIGHSQGGAIAYLLTAYLLQLQKNGSLPTDLHFKTYASAGPKPGNLHFAHEYEAMTQGGWAYNVINAADWVPQTPFSVQTVDDMADVNPFKEAKTLIGNASLTKRWALNYAYGRLSKPSIKARKNYQKYLGNFVARSVKKVLPGFEEPTYFNSNDYVRTGFIITLLPQADYYQQFPEDPKQVFRNHLHDAYLYLAKRLDLDRQPHTAQNLFLKEWQLELIPGENLTTFFPDRKPFIRFTGEQGRFNGNTGCNSMNGTAQIGGSSMRFSENIATTKMACPGTGESAFLTALRSVDSYRIEGGKLQLLKGEMIVLQFNEK